MGTFEHVLGQVRSVGISDILDILVITFFIYQAIRLVRETRAIQLVKGLGLLLGIYIISYYGGLKTVNFIMRNLLQIGALALVVVFQPELRRALERVGRARLTGLGLFSFGLGTEQMQQQWKHCIDAVCESCGVMSREKTGALIVMERETPLGDIVDTGTLMEADPSEQLILNIFYPNTPLHDGAMVIRRGKIHAAGCFLPLSDNFTISKELGTRHRAALGVSEISDALVIVVSEETGKVTLADNGKIKRGLSMDELYSELQKAFLVEKDPAVQLKKPQFWKGKKEA